MVLRRANPLLGALEGVSPENLNFFGFKTMALASLVANSGPTTSNASCYGSCPPQKPLFTVPYKQQVH
jgi:hypothetical protein